MIQKLLIIIVCVTSINRTIHCQEKMVSKSLGSVSVMCSAGVSGFKYGLDINVSKRSSIDFEYGKSFGLDENQNSIYSLGYKYSYHSDSNFTPLFNFDISAFNSFQPHSTKYTLIYLAPNYGIDYHYNKLGFEGKIGLLIIYPLGALPNIEAVCYYSLW